MEQILSIKSEPLKSKLYHILKEMIINNQLEPGYRLVINELREKFGVSSTPVRDALHYLEADGLVENKENGCYVINLSKNDVEEIYEMRELLEVAALEQAFSGFEKQKLTVLREKMVNSNAKNNFANDMEFHNSISESCHNQRMKRQLQTLADQSFQVGYKLHSNTNIHDEIPEHILILDALIKGDLELAKTNLRKHLQNTKSRIIQHCF
jgi:GntR family transcriptional regulator of gluconate operon